MRFPRSTELADGGWQEHRGEPLNREALVSRRAFLAWLVRAGVGLVGWGLPAWGQGTRRIRLGFCGQLLCVVPYEVARFQKYFAEQGLEVELVYFRGGTAAMQALVGGAVDYAATSFDVALAAFARGARIVRFFSTAASRSSPLPPPLGLLPRSGSSRISRAVRSGFPGSGTQTMPLPSTSSAAGGCGPTGSSSRCWAPTSSMPSGLDTWMRAWSRSLPSP